MGRRLQDVKEVFTSLVKQKNRMVKKEQEKGEKKGGEDKIHHSIRKALQ
jgi:hypothetical protein